MDEYTRRELAEAIRYATLAPSTYNTQPWKFDIREGAIRIYPDLERHLPIADPNNRELYISLGCALENLVVALTYFGYGPKVTLFPAGESEECIRVTLRGCPKRTNGELFDAITKRQTNRSQYEARTIPEGDIEKLSAIPLEPGVKLHISSSRNLVARTIRLVMDADEIQMLGENFRNELIQWLRFTSRELRRTRDGLGNESIGIPAGPRWLGSFFMKHLDVATPRAERDKKLLESSAAIALFSTSEDTKSSWINAGRSFERFVLWATAMGIQHAHMNQPIEIPDVRASVESALNVSAAFPQLLLRLGYAKPLPYSIRRSVEDVLIETVDTLLPGRTQS